MNNDDSAGNEFDIADKVHDMFQVSGNCEMCQSRIAKAAKGVKVVISAKWNVEAKVIHLDLDSKATSKSKISQTIANVGHDTEFDKALKAVYDDLPSCCS